MSECMTQFQESTLAAKNVVIPERLCRESSKLPGHGFPTTTSGMTALNRFQRFLKSGHTITQ
jgi:hypothetical protein